MTRQATTGSSARSNSDLDPEHVELLFKTFARRFSHRWAKVFESEEARDVWMHDLKALGVTNAGLRKGLERSAGFAWPPTPKEFADVTRILPEDVGAPDVEVAFREALIGAYPYRRHKWSHKAVYWAAARTGMGDLVERGHRLEALFEAEYARVLQELDALPDVAAPIEDKRKREKPSPEFVAEQIENLKRIVGAG